MAIKDLTQTKINQNGLNRLEALYRLSQVLGASLNLDEVLIQVIDAVIGLTGAERGFLVLLEPGMSTWQVVAARDLNQRTLPPAGTVVSRSVIQTVVSAGHGLVTTDAQADPRFAEHDSIIFHSLRSIMCAPLLARGQVIGVIYVDNRVQVGRFTGDDLQLLSAFAGQAAIAIENARLYTRTDQALSQRVAELETLSRIDEELDVELDFDHVLEITHRWTLQGVQAERAWIALVDPSGNDMEVYPEDQAGLLAQEADRFMQQEERTARFIPAVQDQLAGIIVPILYSGKLLGVIQAVRVHSFEPGEARFLERLARRAAPAMVNARLYQAVQQANQAKTKFVSVVTHELRIPMTSIKGYADLMRAGAVGPVTEQQVGFLNVIAKNVDRMSFLVSDLSDIARIETGRLKLELSRISVAGYIADTLRGLHPRVEEKHQTVAIEIASGLPEVVADPNRLVQVLNNLVSNAVKYTPEGGFIRVSASQQGEFVLVQVSDNGIGISPEDQAQLFTQFFRSEDPAVRDQQGWGLGLSVSQQLVNLMGGVIGVSSAPGAGSTFMFTLPISNT